MGPCPCLVLRFFDEKINNIYLTKTLLRSKNSRQVVGPKEDLKLFGARLLSKKTRENKNCPTELTLWPWTYSTYTEWRHTYFWKIIAGTIWYIGPKFSTGTFPYYHHCSRYCQQCHPHTPVVPSPALNKIVDTTYRPRRGSTYIGVEIMWGRYFPPDPGWVWLIRVARAIPSEWRWRVKPLSSWV